MVTNTAKAEWQGDLPSGKGEVSLGNGAFKGNYSFKSRFENGDGTNPEELIAAAHAACFSMAFSHQLAQAGFPPKSLKTEANVILDKVDGGFAITRIDLVTEAEVPGVTEEQFQKAGMDAKVGCPISKALAGVKDITLKATLKSA